MTDITITPKFRAAYLGALLQRKFPDATPHVIATLVHAMQDAAAQAVDYETRCGNGTLDAINNIHIGSSLRRKLGTVNCKLRLLQMEISNPTLAELLTSVSTPPSPVARIELRGSCASLLIAGERGDGWGDGFAIY